MTARWNEKKASFPSEQHGLLERRAERAAGFLVIFISAPLLPWSIFFLSLPPLLAHLSLHRDAFFVVARL